MPDILVRLANAGDEAGVADVTRSGVATLRKTYRPKPNAATPSRPPTTHYVALLDDRVVGTVQCYADGNRLHVIRLFVHESARRRGVRRRFSTHWLNMR